jgi:hypothetical protein
MRARCSANMNRCLLMCAQLPVVRLRRGRLLIELGGIARCGRRSKLAVRASAAQITGTKARAASGPELALLRGYVLRPTKALSCTFQQAAARTAVAPLHCRGGCLQERCCRQLHREVFRAQTTAADGSNRRDIPQSTGGRSRYSNPGQTTRELAVRTRRLNVRRPQPDNICPRHPHSTRTGPLPPSRWQNCSRNHHRDEGQEGRPANPCN